MKRFTCFSLLFLVFGWGVSALAYEKGDFVFRVGVVNVSPNDDSGEVLGNDGVSVDDNTQLGLTGSYFFSSHVAVEVLAATPFTHDIDGTGALEGLPIGETTHLPPTICLQWFPASSTSAFQPYLGAGINYTLFFSEETTDQLTAALGAQSTDLKLDASFGFALEAGFDYNFSDKWGVNLAVWYIDIETDADVIVNGQTATTVDVTIDPTVVHLAVAYRF
jgi:outer membrane protein